MAASSETIEGGGPDIGTSPPVPADANPMVASVAEAIKSKQHPERLSVVITPPPFNHEAYANDPQAYLSVVEPARVWQSAQPGKSVPPLKVLSPRHMRIQQGETVSLRVQVPPGMPVTFTSFDMGAIQNQLNSITVPADADGVAVGRFTGTRGAVNLVNVLAASPVASGQASFMVEVSVKAADR